MSKYGRSHCPPQHFFIQNKLILAINDPAFKLVLPELRQSSWNRVLLPDPSNDDERERLEFLGDALMHISVALELYKLYPEGTPHLFTVLRSVMNTNSTFTHYMLKVGAFEKRLTEQPRAKADAFDKVAADAFETLIAAYYFEQGFRAVCDWVSDTLQPLIIVARKAYDEFLTDVRPAQRLDKRLRGELDIYLSGKKTKLGVLPEPTHSPGSNHAKDIVRGKQNLAFSTAQDAGPCPVTIRKMNDGRRPMEYLPELAISILDPPKSSTWTANQTWKATGTGNETAAASYAYDSQEGPSSCLAHGDNAAVIVVDGAEVDEWIDIDDGIKMKYTPGPKQALAGTLYSTRGASKIRSSSLLEAFQPRLASTALSSVHPSRPLRTRKLRREARRALRQPHTMTSVKNFQNIIADTTSVAKTSQVSRANVGSNAFDLNLGPIKSNRTGIALEDSGLQSLTGTLISMHAPLQYAIAENDHPDGNKGPLHRKRRTPSLVHSGVGPKAWQREVHDVTMSMSTLLHCSGQDTAPGSSENPISVDNGDTDVAMAG